MKINMCMSILRGSISIDLDVCCCCWRCLLLRAIFVCFWLEPFAFNIEWFLLAEMVDAAATAAVCAFYYGLTSCHICANVCMLCYSQKWTTICLFFIQLGILLQTIQSIMLRSGCFDFFLRLRFFSWTLNVERRSQSAHDDTKSQ